MSGMEKTMPKKKRRLEKKEMVTSISTSTNTNAITAGKSNNAVQNDDTSSTTLLLTKNNHWASIADRLNPNRAAYDPEFSVRYKSMSKAQRKQIQKEDRIQIRKLKQRGKTPLPFVTDDDDHCETSSIAYEHIAPILSYLACRLKKASPSELKIFDPYYCAGGTVQHLNTLGFPNVHNQPDDFYQVIKENKVPIHDVVITNPPYSSDHFDRLIEFLKVNNKPFLLLLPDHFTKNPTYQKHYEEWMYKDVVYVTPPQRYHYWIPEGRRQHWKQQKQGEDNDDTFDSIPSKKEQKKDKKKKAQNNNKHHHHSNLHLGTRNSPFSSLWFISLAPAVKKRKKILKAYKRGNKDNQNNSNHNNPEQVVDGVSTSFVNVSRKRFRLPPGCLLHDNFTSAKKAEQSFRGGGSMNKQQQESSSSSIFSSSLAIARKEQHSSTCASAIEATISTTTTTMSCDRTSNKRKRKRDSKKQNR